MLSLQGSDIGGKVSSSAESAYFVGLDGVDSLSAAGGGGLLGGMLSGNGSVGWREEGDGWVELTYWLFQDARLQARA